MQSDRGALLREIIRCPEMVSIHSGVLQSSPCQKIVSLQSVIAFQVPEPWSGQIDKASLLFISSNPSINELEQYPSSSWSLEKADDFFENRFTSKEEWVDEKMCALQLDGTRGRSVRYWTAARSRASEILSKPRDQIVPGIDFALTEIVHCKSRAEAGVSEARELCSTRYLERILAISAAKVLIVFGRSAQITMTNLFKSRMTVIFNGLCEISTGKRRLVAFLPHPSSFEPLKTAGGCLGSEGLAALRSFL